MADLISRQAVINAFNTKINELVVAGKENADSVGKYLNRVIDKIKELPSVQPEIVYCKDCKRHNISIDDVCYGSVKCCPLVQYRGKAQGHEFDYQFCVCAERKQNG